MMLRPLLKACCPVGSHVQAKLLAALLVAGALLLAACGSQPATTSGSGTTPGAANTSTSGGQSATSTPTPAAPARLTGSVTEFPLSASGSNPLNITTGPDGNLWFTDSGTNQIGRITPGGQITEFPIPTSGNFPWSITAGPDGNIWFRECVFNTGTGRCGAKKIGRITPGGQITEFSLSSIGGALSEGITTGPDGNLWFVDSNETPSSPSANIGRMTPTGQVTEFPLPSTSYAGEITAGPDGNLWFTDGSGQIGRITPQGTITEFRIPTAGSNPLEITAGPDGNLWFTECTRIVNTGQCNNSQIGRITPGGQISEFPLPMPTLNDQIDGITAGPDGNLWFTECSPSGSQCSGGQLGRITPGGQISEFALPTPTSYPHDITTGPDKNLWFTEQLTMQIGRFTPGA